MNNSYITIIKEKRTVLSRKRVPLNQNECTADFRIGVPFEQNLHTQYKTQVAKRSVGLFPQKGELRAQKKKHLEMVLLHKRFIRL